MSGDARVFGWTLLTVGLVTGVQRALVSSTNFGGADEWLLLDLTAHGVLGVPYAHRPLVLLWQALPATLAPGDLRAFALFAGLYFGLCGVLTAALARRLLPQEPLVPLLAGAAAAVWAPLDYLRLDTVLICGYAGSTCVSLAAIAAFVESWQRSRPILLASGALLGCLAASTVEATIPLLAVAPALVGRPEPFQRRRFVAWVLAWWLAIAAAALFVAAPILAGRPSYQTGALGIDPHPVRIAVRVAELLGMQLGPLFSSVPRELLVAGVVLAVLVFLAGALLVWRAAPRAQEAPLVALGGACAAGCLLAVAGQLALALTPRVETPARTQVLAAPGVALALATAATALARVLPRRLRAAAAILAGSWIVAVGTGRVVAMQAEWDAGRNAFPAQSRLLSALTQAAPSLKAGTLVILLEQRTSWPMTFPFRHALRYLYGDAVVGIVYSAEDFLYPSYFTREGVAVVPWPVIRSPWQVVPTFHPWDTIVVAREDADGKLTLLASWPPGELPPLPVGARYAPAERVVARAVRVRERRVLEAAAVAGPGGPGRR
jgi:hypothetical protein